MTSLAARNGRNRQFSREWHSLDPKVQAKLLEMQTAPYIPVGKIARSLGLSVKAATLPDNVCGLLRPCPESDAFEITLNRHKPRVQQRFTLAHEIAHFLLHRDMIPAEGVRDLILYCSNLPDALEGEANRLAADIIMPSHIIDQEIGEIGKDPEEFDAHDVERMAEHLQVSRITLEIRLDIVVI